MIGGNGVWVMKRVNKTEWGYVSQIYFQSIIIFHRKTIIARLVGFIQQNINKTEMRVNSQWNVVFNEFHSRTRLHIAKIIQQKTTLEAYTHTYL